MKTIVYLLGVILIWGCVNGSKSDTKTQNMPAKDTTTTQQSSVDTAIYRFKYNGKTYYYLMLVSEYNDIIAVGITDTNKNVIIPIKYDYVVYPGQTYAGYAEVCKDEKFGLYSFPEGKQIFPAEYDAFYPVYDRNIKFYYKKNGKYGYVAEGDYKNPAYEVSPFENKTAANWNFSTKQYYHISQEQACCMSFSMFPSFFPVDETMLSDDWVEPGPNRAVVKYIGSTSNNNYFYEITLYDSLYLWKRYKKFFAINKKFYESFDVYSELLIRLYNDSINLDDCLKYFTLKIINDTLFRIKNYNDGKGNFDYNYYKITDSGFVKIKTHRKFPFTKYEKLDSSYFYGYFVIGDTVLPITEAPAYVVSFHLSMEDLDIMRNEIYADYGYKFKTKKWKTYFSKIPWYKPLYDDVNDKLSDLEQYNIQVILKERNKIKDDEQKYLHPVVLPYLSAN